MIKLIGKLNGIVVIDRTARDNQTLRDMLLIAEIELSDGWIDYARIEIDGETYAEYET